MNLKERCASISKLISATLSFGVATLAIGAIAVPSASAAGGQSCTGGGTPVIATVNPLYNVENTNSPGGSACVTVSASAEAFHVDSTNWDPSAPGADTTDPYIGFKAIYTGCKNKACLEPEYPALAGSVVSEPTSWTFSSNFSQISGQFDAIYDASSTRPRRSNICQLAESSRSSSTTPAESRRSAEPSSRTSLPAARRTTSGQSSRQRAREPGRGLPSSARAPTKQRACRTSTWQRLSRPRSPTVRSTHPGTSRISKLALRSGKAGSACRPPRFRRRIRRSQPTPARAALAEAEAEAEAEGEDRQWRWKWQCRRWRQHRQSGGGGSASVTKNKAASSAKTAKPHVSLAMPACSTKQSRAKCNAFRRTAGAWRYAYGFASGQDKVTKVIVTALPLQAEECQVKNDQAESQVHRLDGLEGTSRDAHQGPLAIYRGRHRQGRPQGNLERRR